MVRELHRVLAFYHVASLSEVANVFVYSSLPTEEVRECSREQWVDSFRVSTSQGLSRRGERVYYQVRVGQ